MGNLLEGSESVENARILAVASLLRPPSGADEAALMLHTLFVLKDAPEVRFCEQCRRGLRAACLLRLQVWGAWRNTLGLDAGSELLIFIA